jgi:hypothetical protein
MGLANGSYRQALIAQPFRKAWLLSDLDPRDAFGFGAVSRFNTSRVQLGRHLPIDEEGEPWVGQGEREAGRPPPEDRPVRPGARSLVDLQAEASRSPIDVVGRHAPTQPPVAFRDALPNGAADRRSFGVTFVHHSEELDVLAAEGNDPVPRPPSRMPAARHRRQAELLVQPAPGGVEVVHPIDHVVDPQARQASPPGSEEPYLPVSYARRFPLNHDDGRRR